jgi:hypothetical protein
MERFEIQPVLSSTLPDVAKFLHTWHSNESATVGSQLYASEDVSSVERRLRWLLVENPVATEGSRFGYCVRDRLGAIRGLNLAFPAAFMRADQRVLGLCSGSFFVEPTARPMGFYLFRKHLSSPWYSFFFTTTCNVHSAELWRKLGGCAVPGSELEYMLPLRLEVVAPAFVATKNPSEAALAAARICGRFANPVLRLLTRSSADLTIEPCHDWGKLSELSRRHRSPAEITTDRSVDFLQWRYGLASSLHQCDIYLFRDKQGNEGWFSVGESTRGKQRQIRESVLLDAIWPREKMSFRGVFQEILRLTARRADAIFFRSRPGRDYREYSRWAIPHRLAAPRAFALRSRGAPQMPIELLDYDDSEYSAWSLQGTAAREHSDLFPRSLGAKLSATGDA